MLESGLLLWCWFPQDIIGWPLLFGSFFVGLLTAATTHLSRGAAGFFFLPLTILSMAPCRQICRLFAVRRLLVFILIKVTDIMDYEAALSFTVENSSAQHDVVAGATGGPVAPRLDRLIRREKTGTWADGWLSENWFCSIRKHLQADN